MACTPEVSVIETTEGERIKFCLSDFLCNYVVDVNVCVGNVVLINCHTDHTVHL